MSSCCRAAQMLRENLVPVSGVAPQGLLGVEANGEEEGAGRLDGGQGHLLLLRAQLLPLTHRHVLHIAPDQLPHEGLERSIGKGTRIAGGEEVPRVRPYMSLNSPEASKAGPRSALQ